MKFFTTSISKTKIATPRIDTIKKSDLTFLLMLYFQGVILENFDQI